MFGYPNSLDTTTLRAFLESELSVPIFDIFSVKIAQTILVYLEYKMRKVCLWHCLYLFMVMSVYYNDFSVVPNTPVYLDHTASARQLGMN